MSEQLDMFRATEPTPTRGRGERVAVEWVKKHGTTSGYSAGCRCHPCSDAHDAYNRAWRRGRRICQHCGKEYVRDEGRGGGTKFCVECVEAGVYNRKKVAARESRLNAECARCHVPYAKRPGKYWNLCGACTEHPVFRAMMGSLARHNVPLPIVVNVIDWPYCANEACGAWLLERVRFAAAGKRGASARFNYCVDHDHQCCPGSDSCGQCVRGIVCHACNSAMPAGMDSVRANGLARYLEEHERVAAARVS